MQQNNVHPSTLQLLRDTFPEKSRLCMDSLASFLDMKSGSIRNAICEKRFPIHTYNDNGHRYADLRDIADHLDSLRKQKRPVGRPRKIAKFEASAHK